MKIGIISDIHLGRDTRFRGVWRKISNQSLELTRRFVHEMNTSFQPDFVFNLGDVIQETGTPSDAENFHAISQELSALHAPMYPVVGNHDLLGLTSAQILEVWNDSSAVQGFPTLEQGKLYYQFHHSGVNFIVLQSLERKDNYVWLDMAQLDWLHHALEAAQGPVMIVVHHSLAEQDTDKNWWFRDCAYLALIRERPQVRQMLEASGKVIGVLNGHLHWNDRTDHHNIPYLTVQSLVENAHNDDPPVACGAWGQLTLTPGKGALEVFGHDPFSTSWTWEHPTTS